MAKTRTATVKTGYKVVQRMALWNHARKAFTQDMGLFQLEDVDEDPKKAQALVDRWIKDGQVEVSEEIVAGKPPKASTSNKKGTTKGAKVAKIWTLKPEDLAELSLEELNLKIVEIAAEKKVEAPTFDKEVDAIHFLTKDA